MQLTTAQIGVGNTTPPLSIFKDPIEAGKFFSEFPLNMNESISSFGDAYSMALILGDLAADRAKKVAESLSTPTVVRDMMSILNALGQEKLQYWGVS